MGGRVFRNIYTGHMDKTNGGRMAGEGGLAETTALEQQFKKRLLGRNTNSATRCVTLGGLLNPTAISLLPHGVIMRKK